MAEDYTDIQVQLDDKESEALKKRIGNLLFYGKMYWSPLNARQDYWASLYFLLDVIQQQKPIGYRRFVSNEPRTAVDAAVSIMTRNDSFWRIDLSQLESENKDERLRIGKVERTLQGIVNDIDELFSMRGALPLWKQICYQALLRGWIWAKVHVTTQALAFRSSPLIAEVYDARLVYPHFDTWGLAHVIIEKHETMGSLAATYPAVFADYAYKPDFNPHMPATKVEFWSNDRGDMDGVMGCLAIPNDQAAATYPYTINTPPNEQSLSGARWVIPPMRHGYPPEALPIIGVPVNGVALHVKPMMNRALAQNLNQRADILGVQTASWQGPATWVAESGRSILSSVEEQIPQFNELVATIFQHFSIGTYGTWIFKTPTGELPNAEFGIEARIPLRPEEEVQRIEPNPISPDAYRLLEILRDEQQKGTLSSILRATLPMGGGELGSGILFQQMTNAALNALEPYHDGIEQFSTRMGTSLLAQMQLASADLQPFQVSVPVKTNTFFSIEFDPQTDLEQGRKYRARAIFRPALPDDMSMRVQIARFALDPRKPILSLVTVLERILQIEDPQGEIDRIWEDMANMDPIIALEQIATALDRIGEPELATRIREAEFRQKAVEDLQYRQMTGNVPQLGGGGQQQPGMTSDTGAPASTQQTGTPADAQQRALMQEGMQLMGQMGQRTGV